MHINTSGPAAGLLGALAAVLTSHAVHHKVDRAVSEDLVKLGLGVVYDLIRPQALCSVTPSCNSGPTLH